jgi:hypothetical protein
MLRRFFFQNSLQFIGDGDSANPVGWNNLPLMIISVFSQVSRYKDVSPLIVCEIRLRLREKFTQIGQQKRGCPKVIGWLSLRPQVGFGIETCLLSGG